MHLVGSIPLANAEEVFRTAATSLGDWLWRLPDGETGPRGDWIVWQYPLFSSRPQFEICPPRGDQYRALPRLRIRDTERVETIAFEDLGYAQAAISSYRTFATLKRDGIIPSHCRFQVSLPTPAAPISAFVADEDQQALEPLYEARMLRELLRIVETVPADQLAIQWDTNVEFGMLEGVYHAWFSDVRAGVIERLVRLARSVPPSVQLGYHLCYGDETRHFTKLTDPTRLIQVANDLSTKLDRPLNWIHLPVPPEAAGEYFRPFRQLALRSETELYLGLVYLRDGPSGTKRRIEAARKTIEGFGVSTECGWGRRSPDAVPALLEIHRSVAHAVATESRPAAFEWPDGFVRIPDADWTEAPLDEFGLGYDRVDEHGWYSNLNPLVEELAQALQPRDILVDYSGGTGILVNRLLLRIFDAPIGALIADPSQKFLRVALERFRNDGRVAFRLLRFLREEGRLQWLDEVLPPALLERGIDKIVSANAIHLYSDLVGTLASWVRVLRPGGRVFIGSGNIRNPRSRANEWILDETVWVVSDLAEGLVRTDPRWAAYRSALDDPENIKAHSTFRDRVFLRPRPLDSYLDAIRASELAVDSVTERTIEASVEDWFEFLSTYHDAVLGWVGGTERINGAPPTTEAIADRLALMRHAMHVLFGGRPTFQTCWTYIMARKAGEAPRVTAGNR